MTIEPDTGIDPEAYKAAIEAVALEKEGKLSGDYFSVTQGAPDSPVSEVFTLCSDGSKTPIIESAFKVCAADESQPDFDSKPTTGPLPS